MWTPLLQKAGKTWEWERGRVWAGLADEGLMKQEKERIVPENKQMKRAEQNEMKTATKARERSQEGEA